MFAASFDSKMGCLYSVFDVKKQGKTVWVVRARNWKLRGGENRLSGLLEGVSIASLGEGKEARRIHLDLCSSTVFENYGSMIKQWGGKDSEEYPSGPITRARAIENLFMLSLEHKGERPTTTREENFTLLEHAIKAGVIHLLRPSSDEDQLGIGRVTSPSGSQGRARVEKGESAHQGKKPSRGNTSVSAFFLEWTVRICAEHGEEYDGEIDDEQAYERATRQGLRRQEPRHQRARPRVDDNLNKIKINIPPFQGKTDPEAYLAWEKKIEHIFECHNYSELKKVKLAAIEFTDYALIWLDQLTASRRRNGERPISTWNEMKAVMRRRFIPTHYHRELFNKLQNLTQGNRSVEDYYKEMEVAMIRANIDEDREATMARFLAGLDPNIAAIVELQHYVEIEDMVHMAMKVERQLKKKGTTRAYGGSTTKWGQGPYKPKPTFSPNEKGGPSRNVKPIAETNKGKGTTMPARSRDVQCFKCLGRGHIASQCPNRNTMLLRDDGEVESEQEEEENENDAIQEEEELEHAVEGEALIVKRSLSMQPMEGDEQRENIFHARCHIGGKVCFVIIDGGSCTSVASTLMVEKLGLATTKHPRPYKLQWLNDGGELKVSKQVLIVFSIGKYKDEVLCDVVPMHAGHLLLGRPWQFDRRVVHDGYTNRYTFTHEARKITLAPLSPTQVQKDQIHLRNSFERAKEREAKIELTASRRRNGERPISTWNEMKAVMRRRFIPTHYHRELFNKLQNLTQGNRSVDDYYKEREGAMIRANIDEDREATMERFLAGLDPNIAAIVELQHYVEIEDMVHMAMKVERQLKKKGGPSRNVKPIAETNKGKGIAMPTRSRDVQCFKCLGRGHIASQCPNRNTMLLRDDGEVESEQEEEENENDAIQKKKKN
ncbi:hypothetical protein GQ457_09G015490 [Hibiscus cannabinus]